MKNIVSGIYKITNKINNKIYIGQSQNIFSRWAEHRYEAKTNMKPLYKAMRKYGIENFIFEIIEECEIEKLNDREVYWIKYYDSYNKGYNLTPGGDYSSKTQRIVSNEDVINIRKRRLNTETFSDVYKDYTYLNESTFKNVWQGVSYTDIYVEGFTKENLEYVTKIAKRKESAKRQNSKMTEELVLQIRVDKKNGMKRKDAYIKYQNYFTSIGGFDSIWYNQRWKEIQPL